MDAFASAWVPFAVAAFFIVVFTIAATLGATWLFSALTGVN